MQLGQAQPDSNRRMIGLAGVVVFHALLIWGLVSGLARKAIEILPAPIETKIIEEVKPPDEPPPLPPPQLVEPPPPFVPPPEINISTPPPAHAISAQNKVATPPPKAAPAPPPSVALRVDGRRCRAPEYPSVSQRLGEKGSVTLQLLVDTDGRVKDSKLVTSSGYPRLDEAARRGLTLCRFDAPSTASWGTIKYTFRPED
jgi:protein TonB